MTTRITTPRPLYGWAQPTQAGDWITDMFERLPDDGWLYELIEGRVVRMPPPGPDHGRIESKIDYVLRAPGAEQPHTLAGDTTLDAGDVIPGVHIHLNDIW